MGAHGVREILDPLKLKLWVVDCECLKWVLEIGFLSFGWVASILNTCNTSTHSSPRGRILHLLLLKTSQLYSRSDKDLVSYQQ